MNHETSHARWTRISADIVAGHTALSDVPKHERAIVKQYVAAFKRRLSAEIAHINSATPGEIK